MAQTATAPECDVRARKGTSEVADAMEAVLEETLRLNRQLEAKMAKMRGAEPKGPSRRLVGGVVSE